MPRPSPEEVKGARERYRKHDASVTCEQCVEVFTNSPYFVWIDQAKAKWTWNFGMLRMDTVILAQNDIAEHPLCSASFIKSKPKKARNETES